MRDALFVLIVIGFFALAALYVRACAAVVGAEASAIEPANDTEESA